MLQPRFLPFPELETERLVLKEITRQDAPMLLQLRSNRDVMKYIERPLASSIDDVNTLIDLIADNLHKNEGLTWGIFLKDGDSGLKGTIGFWRLLKEHYRAEIGYLLDPSLQGMGLMFEAMQEALRYGFNQIQLHSVEANVHPENKASIRLLEKAGFVREAYFRENYFFNNNFGDTAVYSLINRK